MAQAHREERLLPREQPVDRSPQRHHLGVVVVTRVTGTGTDDDQVGVVETPLDVRVVPHHVAGHAEHAQHVAQHVHEVVLAVEDPHVLAAQRRVRRRARLVGQPERREPAVAGVQRDQHVLVAGERGDVERGDRGRRHQPEGTEDAARLGVRLGHLVGRLGVAHQRGTGRHLQPAVDVDVGGADQDRAVHRRASLGVAAEQRERGAVVAAALRLVRRDQPAGVLDRRAGDRGGVHRVAQDLARVAVAAAGEEVLGVDEVGHRLEERPEHLPALVADVAHHLQLLVDHHEELVDLLLVGEEVEQPVLDVTVAADPEGAADRVHPDVAAADADVALRARADQVAVAGEEAERPVGAGLALEQPPVDGQRAVGVPVGDDRPVVPADDQVGALALADLVADDLVDDLAVRRVVGVEAAAVGELDGDVRQRGQQVVDLHLVLGLDVDHHQRGAVVDRLEPALPHLPERHRDQPVGEPPGLGRPLLQRDVEQRRDLASGSRRPAPRSARPCAG